MELVEFLKLGGSIKLNKKMKMQDWYGEFSLSYFDKEPFFQGFHHHEYRKNISIEESVYVFLSVYKHWENLAYIVTRLQNKSLLTEDPESEDFNFEYPSPKFLKLIKSEKKLAKEDWLKEFSEEKLKSLKKPIVKNVNEKLEVLLKGKKYTEYSDVLNNYLIELINLGLNARVYFYFERGEKQGCYGVELKNKEYSKNQINALINKTNKSLEYESISISIYIDEEKYSYHEKV
jgi:hypothetical protein